jgi:hypothetical protein
MRLLLRIAALAVLAPVAAAGIGLCGCRSSDCEALGEMWDSLVYTPAMTACAAPDDCIAVGGQPPDDPCNGHSAIGYCGAAVNAKAYYGSFAPRLESSFAASCTNRVAHDCSPAYAECFGGRCVVRFAGCCGGCRPDASWFEGRDAPETPIDGGHEPLDAAGDE